MIIYKNQVGRIRTILPAASFLILIFFTVKKITKELKEIKEKDNINLNSLKPDEMKKFVNCLPQHKLDRRNLEIHFNAIEYILKKEVF